MNADPLTFRVCRETTHKTTLTIEARVPLVDYAELIPDYAPYDFEHRVTPTRIDFRFEQLDDFPRELAPLKRRRNPAAR